MAHVADLGEDLPRSEVPNQPALGGEAEAAVLGAAHLARDAQRGVVALRDEDTFDAVPVGEPEQVFAGAVRGGFNRPALQAFQREVLRQNGADLLGQVRHFVEAVLLAQVDPAQDLAGPVRGDAVLLQPRCELRPREVQDVA